MVHVRLVALERVELSADENERAEDEQRSHRPARDTARPRGDGEEGRPQDETDEHAAEVEEEVGRRKPEDARMPLAEVDREDANRRSKEEGPAGPPTHPRRSPGRHARPAGQAPHDRRSCACGFRGHGVERNIQDFP